MFDKSCPTQKYFFYQTQLVRHGIYFISLKKINIEKQNKKFSSDSTLKSE